MTVIVAVVVPVIVLILVTATMITFTQLVDVIGTYARLGHLVNDVAPGMVVVRAVHMSRIGSGPQYGTANRRMRAGITTKAADSRIHDKARDQRDQRLRSQEHRHGLHGHLLGEQQRQHLIGGRKEHGNQRAQRHDTAGVQRCCHGRKSALRHHAQQRSDNRTRGSGALDSAVDAVARNVLKGFKSQIRHQQKRH